MHNLFTTTILTGIVLATTQCSCLPATEYAKINNPSSKDVTAIQQTLGLFPIAIDTKQFDLLDAVFTPTATGNFTGHSVAVGLPAIKSYFAQGLTGLVSQHNLATLYINMTGTEKATAHHWVQDSYFGTGNATESIYMSWGYHEDDLVKSRGRWLVQKRVSGTSVSRDPDPFSPLKQ
ncbi:MAG: hypothetical protein Q9224_005382, partial [Gallowayella concinna]